MRAGLPLCVGLVLAGCARRAEQPAPARASPQPEIEPLPPTTIAEKKEELGQPSWDPQWDGDCGEGVVSGDAYAASRSRCKNVLPTIRQIG